MKKYWSLTKVITLAFLLGFLIFDFIYLLMRDGVKDTLKNFIPVSLTSLLFYRVYLLLMILISVNILYVLQLKMNNKFFYYCRLVLPFIILVGYGVSVDIYYLFFIPSILILLFQIGNGTD